MYFKQIEMTGFKSFADRTVVNMERGMTSIVGPNGCGKSNILDALRWALGEQSPKSLRGAHMQDVIFNGSEERSPTGMAEVTLTFDNAEGKLPIDFAEVQISRRVYRSGESEYLINKAPCRLRDIQELFMDTGIGTNAYSMIGQGKISLVLSSKPDDRRFLFEEAAGIIKYKARKKVALRKLDQAEQNLIRLGDIVAEVQRQMRSLKRQVNAAIRHRELTDQLKQLEIRASWLNHRLLTEKIDSLRERFAEAQNAFEKDSAEQSQLEARYEELSIAKLEVDRVLHARREGVHEIENEMEKIERQIALIRQQIEFSGEQKERAEHEQKELKEQAEAIAALRVQTAEREKSLSEESDASHAALQTKTAAHEEALQHTAAADTALESARARSVESMGMRAKAQTAVETITVSIQNIEVQLTNIYERQQAEIERNEELVAQLEKLRRAETVLETTLEQLEQERGRLAEEESNFEARLKDAAEQWQALREKSSSVEARLRSLRELRDSYEGFATGVRAVMRARRANRPEMTGVIGPVGDLVSTEKKYERAIEASLGGSVNNIVVDSAETAKGAVNYLKEQKAGRVTFLPLDLIRNDSRDNFSHLTGAAGVIGPALDVIQFEPRVERAMRYLFRNTMIVESIDDAIRLAGSAERYPRLVTLDGEVVAPSGAVTGGRTRHDSRGILGRSAEIEELEEEAKRLEDVIAEASRERDSLSDAIGSLRTRIQELAGEESERRNEFNELGVDIARQTTELTSLTAATEALNRERDELSARRTDLEQQRREADELAANMESEDEGLQRDIAEAQDTAARSRQAQSVLAGELSDLRVNLANLTSTLEETQRDLHRQQREIETARAEAERRGQSIQDLETNRTKLENDIEEHIERSKALSETKEEARKKVIEAENQRQGLLDESEQLESALKKLRDQVREGQSAVHQFELELRHDEDQRAFFEERILSEYHIALSSLSEDQVGDDEYDDETREKLVQEIRTKLERMGTVNLMAIEEYEALTERNDFLVAQESDLRSARESLLNVVTRIDETIKEMFMQTFRDVSENFRQYFRRLFNGGQARIYLLDEDDPLESGIEIEARPPGKKPQTISLLSGGEQAMTAIALLFSIFKAKPSPFCVLDEVDAPLDDANIGRFLTMVEEFSEGTQFVVITHSKQTMARADVLYGVTMQERGVSQLVSVRFDEVPETETAEPAA